MAHIQIRRSRYKSTSVYVVAKAGSGVGVEFRARSGSGEPETGPKELGVVVIRILAGFFLFAVAPLGVKSSSSLLGPTEPL